MTKPEARPALNDFVAGYPGPADIQFQGGSITVVAALVYEDGIRLEWRMPSFPDLSWMDDVTLDAERELPTEDRGFAGLGEASLGIKRLRELWARATLSDGRCRDIELRFERSAPLSLYGGYEGAATCSCQPPTDSSALTLHFGGADIAISLRSGRRPENAKPSLFRAGYAGPKKPLDFHDGAIKLISTLVYEDRIVIEWLVDPPPDLSWLFHDQVSEYMRPGPGDENQRLLQARWSMNFKRTMALWMSAHLHDDLRTEYVGSLGNSGAATSGFKGRVCFTPSAPPGARELNLTLYDLSIFIPLVSR